MRRDHEEHGRVHGAARERERLHGRERHALDARGSRLESLGASVEPMPFPPHVGPRDPRAAYTGPHEKTHAYQMSQPARRKLWRMVVTA